MMTRIKTSINEDTSDSGLGAETVSSQMTLDSDFDEDDMEIENNRLFDLDEEQETNSIPKFKNKLLDLSDCSLNSNSPLSCSFQARRCLFKQSPTPQSSCVSKLNLSTPNKVIIKSGLESKITDCKQITPISSYRNNSIILNQNQQSSCLNFSFNNNSPIAHLKQEVEEESSNLKDIHQMIMQSLDYECSQQQQQAKSAENSRLIGDRSRYHLLPCTTTIKHTDLSVITPNTFKKLLDGEYDQEIAKLIVIDARYPYEYEGGHIRNAKNVYTREKLLEMFLENREKLTKDCDPSKRFIIVFHCEFSSERGPNLLRFLRNQDRLANKDSYPKLFYPEVYLLEGGYKAFYEKSSDYCEPKTYKPMLHQDHVQDLKHFRSKAKTWELQHKQLSSIHASTYKTSSSSRLSINSKFQRFQSNLF